MKQGWEKEILGNLIYENKKSIFKVRDASNDGDYIFFTSGKKTKRMNTFLVAGENIIVSTGGKAVVSYFKGKACYSTDAYCITALREKSNTKFLYYYILSIYFF